MIVDPCEALAEGKQLEFKGTVIKQPDPSSAITIQDAMAKSTDFFGAYTGNPPPVCKSGIPLVDDTLRGLMPGSLSVLAARTKVGKTSLTVWFATNAAINGEMVGTVHLEDEIEIIGTKMLSMLANVEELKIQNGTLNDIEKQKIKETERASGRLKIRTAKVSGFTATHVEQYVRDLANQGCRTVFVDYLHCITPSAEAAGNETTAIGLALDRLHTVAIETNVAIILLAQLNRPKMVWSREQGGYVPDESIPSVHDIRGSAMIANKARLALIAYKHHDRICVRVALSSRGGCEGRTMEFERDRKGILRMCK